MILVTGQRDPAVLRFGVLGAAVAGALGAIVGLVVGLRVYAPTAWAAAVEIGLPACVAGGLIGVVIGAAADLVAARRRRRG